MDEMILDFLKFVIVVALILVFKMNGVPTVEIILGIVVAIFISQKAD